jgi:uncharacterized phage protein (TIGR01671 family)
VVIEQFTGLLDRNGKEIFEGDVVIYSFDSLNYRMEFMNGTFILRQGYKNIKDLEPTEFDYGLEVEVIGNVHEHPELR